jgi:hypothetical protein
LFSTVRKVPEKSGEDRNKSGRSRVIMAASKEAKRLRAFALNDLAAV